jgi:replicative DNA helicase
LTLPRFDLEAEHAVVSMVMSTPEMLHEVGGLLSPSDYYDQRSRVILAAAMWLSGQGREVGAVAIGQRLLGEGQLELAGGVAGIAEVLGLPYVGRFEDNVRLVRNLARARRLASLAQRLEVESRIVEDIPEWLRRAEAEVFEISRDTHSRETTATLSEDLESEFEAIEERRGTGAIPGISTGIRALDKQIGGFRRGCGYVVAGRPGMGKSAFAWCCCIAAADAGLLSVFVSLEMPRPMLTQRALAGETGLDVRAIEMGELDHSDWQLLAAARARLAKIPMAVDDSSGLDLPGVRSAIRRSVARLRSRGHTGDLGVVAVDYLQLMRGNSQNREERVSDNSAGLTSIAKEFNCAVLIGSQLNRGLEARDDKRPRLSDLRESGAIEQDATGVLMLHRPDYYDTKRGDLGRSEVAEVLVRKLRQGGTTGTVRVAFDGPRTRFTDIPSEPDGYEDQFDNERPALDSYGRKIT